MIVRLRSIHLNLSTFSCVNDVATDGTTPLYLASQEGNLDCVKYLYSIDCKCNARARDGMLPIHAAAQNGHLDCLGYLVRKERTLRTLHIILVILSLIGYCMRGALEPIRNQKTGQNFHQN